MDGSGRKTRGVGETDRVDCKSIGWLLGLDKASLMLIVGFITDTTRIGR